MKNFNLEIPKFYITSQLFLHKAPTFKTIKLLDIHLTIMLSNKTPLSV